eukprot:TRINITY_DN50708_c0_g1_i1.p1 TRINITY_DN50708_c0_g1~~TRINITY_DN50708_c0_g1_i1.p1  ORF type:complete len:313 (+),score=77.86 TRINITY_DN50708_c0_g1_i1:77-1015(+)
MDETGLRYRAPRQYAAAESALARAERSELDRLELLGPSHAGVHMLQLFLSPLALLGVFMQGVSPAFPFATRVMSGFASSVLCRVVLPRLKDDGGEDGMKSLKRDALTRGLRYAVYCILMTGGLAALVLTGKLCLSAAEGGDCLDLSLSAPAAAGSAALGLVGAALGLVWPRILEALGVPGPAGGGVRPAEPDYIPPAPGNLALGALRVLGVTIAQPLTDALFFRGFVYPLLRTGVRVYFATGVCPFLWGLSHCRYRWEYVFRIIFGMFAFPFLHLLGPGDSPVGAVAVCLAVRNSLLCIVAIARKRWHLWDI